MLLHDSLLSVSTADKIPVYNKEEESFKPGRMMRALFLQPLCSQYKAQTADWGLGIKHGPDIKMQNSDYA